MTQIDKYSNTWRTIKSWAEKQKQRQIDIACTPGMGPTETENARGALQLVEELLRMEPRGE